MRPLDRIRFGQTKAQQQHEIHEIYEVLDAVFERGMEGPCRLIAANHSDARLLFGSLNGRNEPIVRRTGLREYVAVLYWSQAASWTSALERAAIRITV